MRYQEFAPPPLLRRLVENFWTITHGPHEPPLPREVVAPDGNASLMFVRQAVNRCDPQCDSRTVICEKAVLVGQKSRPFFYDFQSTAPLQTIGVRFTTVGLSRFTALPMLDLTDSLIPAEEAFGSPFREAVDRVFSLDDPVDQLRTVQRYLLSALSEPGPEDLLVEGLIRQIQKADGQLSIAELCRRSYLHHRRLDRLFARYVGLSPKAYSRILRFHSAILAYNRRPEQRLTDLAYSCGYFDQMHFIREVKAFTTRTPKHYFRHRSGHFQTFLWRLLQRRGACISSPSGS